MLVLNPRLSGLAEICRQYKFTSKLLVVNSYQSGHKLLEALAQYGVPWLNYAKFQVVEISQEAGKSR